MRHVCAYLRVSTRHQDTENQMIALERWIAEGGHKLQAVYRENESAWRQGHQHELSRLIRELPNRKVDTLWVWALDRLTRQGGPALAQTLATFHQRGIDVVSSQETWMEQEGLARDVLITVWGYMAKDYSERLSARVLAGLVKAKAKGTRLGRPPGSKDKGKRKRTGYLLRYANKKTPAAGGDGGNHHDSDQQRI